MGEKTVVCRKPYDLSEALVLSFYLIKSEACLNVKSPRTALVVAKYIGILQYY